MLGVGQSDEGQPFAFPITLKSPGPVRTDGEDDRVTRGEGRQLIAQAREMGAAVRSHEPPQENQHNILFPEKIRQVCLFPIDIRQFKIRCSFQFL